jgi:hypothetical protein
MTQIISSKLKYDAQKTLELKDGLTLHCVWLYIYNHFIVGGIVGLVGLIGSVLQQDAAHQAYTAAAYTYGAIDEARLKSANMPEFVNRIYCDIQSIFNGGFNYNPDDDKDDDEYVNDDEDTGPKPEDKSDGQADAVPKPENEPGKKRRSTLKRVKMEKSHQQSQINRW